MPRPYSLKLKSSVLEYLKSHSGEETARHFNIDTRRIRAWKKQRENIESALKEKKGNSKRLAGGGRKIKNPDVEQELLEFITEKRRLQLRVSRRMVKDKARELFSEYDEPEETCSASNGWLQKFLKRNHLSYRRRTGTAQKDPKDLIPKIVSFILYVDKLRKKNKFAANQTIAMDETGVNFDMLDGMTVAPTGSKDVTMMSTGHEKNHFTVILAARGDGTKLKPMIIFKDGLREVARLQKEQSAVHVACTKNGWVNESLTIEWLDKALGKSLFSSRLLVWDSYKAHLTETVKRHILKMNVKMAVVPGGCTKYIQAPDVSWNKPFKAEIREKYDAWLAGDSNKELTKPRGNSGGGNLKPPSKELICQWVSEAWRSLSGELISSSFKSCALTTALDGSEDTFIHCLKEGQPCREGWELLLRLRDENQQMEREIVAEGPSSSARGELVEQEITLSDSEDDELISLEEELDE